MKLDFFGSFFSKVDLTLIILFFLNSFGLFYLVAQEVDAGGFYLNMAFLTISIAFFINFLSPDFLKKLNFFHTNSKKGVIMFVAGFSIPLILKLIGIVSSNFLSPKFMFSEKLYQAYTLQNLPFYDMFISVFSASVQEELLFGFIFLAIGMIISYFFFRQVFGIDFRKDKHDYYLFAITSSLISGLLFSAFHSFNPTYAGIMFLIAFIFRVVMNFVILSGAGLIFAIGYHFSNNLLALGTGTIIKAFTSTEGLILLFFLIAFIILVIKSWRVVDDTIFGRDLWG